MKPCLTAINTGYLLVLTKGYLDKAKFSDWSRYFILVMIEEDFKYHGLCTNKSVLHTCVPKRVGVCVCLFVLNYYYI